MTLTPLQRRLARASQSPKTSWLNLIENVPTWPAPPPMRHLPDAEADAYYAPSQGVEPLLDALRRREQQRGVAIGTSSLLVTNGAFDALGLVARHLAEIGARRAICAGPVLTSVADLIAAAGLVVVVRDWSALVDGQAWKALRPGPSDLLYVNSPHNPTGRCLTAATAHGLLGASRRFGFSLLLDLVYDSYVHAATAVASPMALLEDWRGVYAVNSFSKNYGMPGLRVGWTVGDPAAVAELTARLEWERIAVATAAQLRAAVLCSYGNAPLVERVAAGRQLVLDWAREHEVDLAALDGGTQAWVDLGVGDVERFADRLMAEHHVLVTTGANYHPADRRRLRLPLGQDPSRLWRGLDLIVRARRRLRLAPTRPPAAATTGSVRRPAGGERASTTVLNTARDGERTQPPRDWR